MQRRFVSLALGLAIAACVGASHAQQELVVRFGASAPLTGPQAHYGKDYERGATLAIEELNARGLSVGGRKVRWELVSEDDAADPRQAASVAQKFVDMKVNGIVGHLNSGTTLPASKIYADAGLPMITPSSTNPKITHQGFKNVFRALGNDGNIGSGVAKYLYKEMGIRKVAIVDDRTAYGQGVADEFEKAFKAAGGSVVTRQYTNDKATEFSAILTAIKARAPDLLFYGGMDSQGVPLYRQMLQLGIKAKFAGGDGLCTLEMSKATTVGPDRNAFCGEAGQSLARMKGGREFEERFKKRFNTDIVLYAPYAYDATMVLANAVVAAQSEDPDKYLAAMRKTNYHGVTADIRFDPYGDLMNAAVTMHTFEKGQRVPLAVVD